MCHVKVGLDLPNQLGHKSYMQHFHIIYKSEIPLHASDVALAVEC